MSAPSIDQRTISIKQEWQDDAPSCLSYSAFDGVAAYVGTLPLPANPLDRPKLGLQDDVSKFDELVKLLDPVPSEKIYPAFAEGLTRFKPGDDSQALHLKGPNLTNYAGDDDLAKTLLQEALIHERLRTHPHPNLDIYLGCVAHNDLIVRLVFRSHIETLSRRREDMNFSPQQRQDCMDKVESAAKHLHSLGLAHNDISPANIMFGDGDSVFLIDLESCLPWGHRLSKGGLVGGWRGPFGNGQQFESSSAQCDILAIEDIRRWLME